MTQKTWLIAKLAKQINRIGAESTDRAGKRNLLINQENMNSRLKLSEQEVLVIVGDKNGVVGFCVEGREW